MNTREELRKKFLETCCYKEMESESVRYPSEVFDFFYAEIEVREQNKNEIISQDSRNVQTLLDRLSILESTLEAADEVIQASGDLSTYNTHNSIVEKYKDKLNAYHQLKTKSQS